MAERVGMAMRNDTWWENEPVFGHAVEIFKDEIQDTQRNSAEWAALDYAYGGNATQVTRLDMFDSEMLLRVFSVYDRTRQLNRMEGFDVPFLVFDAVLEKKPSECIRFLFHVCRFDLNETVWIRKHDKEGLAYLHVLDLFVVTGAKRDISQRHVYRITLSEQSDHMILVAQIRTELVYLTLRRIYREEFLMQRVNHFLWRQNKASLESTFERDSTFAELYWSKYTPVNTLHGKKVGFFCLDPPWIRVFEKMDLDREWLKTFLKGMSQHISLVEGFLVEYAFDLMSPMEQDQMNRLTLLEQEGTGKELVSCGLEAESKK